MFISSRHAGSTHDSTVFASIDLYDHLSQSEAYSGLPSWAFIAADDAYGNSCAGGRIVTPYSGRNLENVKDSFNYYLSSLRITAEQVFRVIVCRWSILWSPIRCSLARATRIIVVCENLHNYIIDQHIGRGGENLDFNDIHGPDLDSNVQGEPEIFLQDYLHLDGEVAPHIRQGYVRCVTSSLNNCTFSACSAQHANAELDIRLQIDSSSL
jgi:hypothetical protein